MSDLINTIKIVSNKVSDSEIDRLRIEEEILIMLVKSSKNSLRIKTEAFSRIEVINKKQLEILGALNKKAA